jgi:hypothetical protein
MAKGQMRSNREAKKPKKAATAAKGKPAVSGFTQPPTNVGKGGKK